MVDALQQRAGGGCEEKEKVKLMKTSNMDLVDLFHRIKAGDSTAELQFLSLAAKTKIPEGFCVFPVVDVSGSMGGTPMAVAVTLGMLVAYAQHRQHQGRADRLVMTFDSNPRVYRLPDPFDGRYTVREVVESMQRKPAGLSTDFNKSMRLMLKELVRRKAENEEDLTPVLLVATDMQFDCANAPGAGEYESNLDALERDYAAAGIRMPIIVLWNLKGSSSSAAAAAAQPSRKNVVMLSGYNAELVEEFFGMLGSGQFRDLHADAEDEGADAAEQRPQLDTDEYVRRVLSSKMYQRLAMP